MTAPEKAANDRDLRKSGKKEWRRPTLRKLPIAATAHDVNNTGNDGNLGKQGKAGGTS
jgi:hypothetical protein